MPAPYPVHHKELADQRPQARRHTKRRSNSWLRKNGRKPGAIQSGASRNEFEMRSVSPRPVVVRVHQTWSITPGMSFSVAQDIDNRVWIVENCPAGTQFWSLSQAAMLTGGEKTGDPLEAALSLGRSLQARLANKPVHRRPALRFGMPALKDSVRSAERSHSASNVDTRRSRELVGV